MSNRHIKLAIIGAGLTQRKAALDAAVSEARLSAAIHGRGTLTDPELRRLAGVLGIPSTALALPATV